MTAALYCPEEPEPGRRRRRGEECPAPARPRPRLRRARRVDGGPGAHLHRRRHLRRRVRQAPGPLALLNTLKPRPPFAHLILADQDRLGREQIETAYILKQLSQAGVRIWEAQDGGREVQLDSPRVEDGDGRPRGGRRDRARQGARAHPRRAPSEGRARLRHRRRPLRVPQRSPSSMRPDGGRMCAVMIVEAEAAVVRRLFALYAEGLGCKTVARQLNAEGAPCPAPRRHATARLGALSGAVCVLNPSYTGDRRVGPVAQARCVGPGAPAPGPTPRDRRAAG